MFDFTDYITGKISTKQLKEMFGYPTRYSVERMFKELNLFEEYKIARAKRRANTAKRTFNQKYGVDNVFQASWCKEKIKQTTKDRHGVDFISQSEDFKKKIDYHNNGKLAAKNCIDKVDSYAKEHSLIRLSILKQLYGVGWISYFNPKIIKYNSRELVDIKYQNLAKDYFEFKQNNKSRSYCEKEIEDFLRTFYFKEIMTNTRTIIKPYELDFYLPDVKIAIEENDSFWHEDNPFSRIADYEEYHNRKKELCNNLGIKLIIIDRQNWVTNQSTTCNMIKTIILDRVKCS